MTDIRVGAQDLNFDEHVRQLIESGGRDMRETAQDTIRPRPSDLPESASGRDTVPAVRPDNVRREEAGDRPLQMSDDALFWSRHALGTRMITPYMTFRDLIIVNPLFMPVLFRAGNVMPAEEIRFYRPDSLFGCLQKPLVEPAQTLEKAALTLHLRNTAYRYIQRHNIRNFHYIAGELPRETTHFISGRGKVRPVTSIKRVEADPTELPSLPKFIPDRRYWTSSFTSDVKFSQAYVSPNWHKGGSSNFNVLSRSQLHYDYAKDRVQMKNLIEINASLYTTSNDTIHDYRFSDDIFRIYSNVGYRAFSKWFYTMDFEFKTPLFINYQENTRFMQTALLSPFIVNLGVGMKYDLTQKFTRKDRAVAVALNLAPLSFSYMYSMRDTIDLGRHGFPVDAATGRYEHVLSKFGSTLRFDMTVKPNRNVTWKSRLYYFTSYDRIIGEFENSLDLAISRYFSTLINLHLRYDDGVDKRDDYNTFLQTNEVLSFGFSYKW
jgi:hypothetical protein